MRTESLRLVVYGVEGIGKSTFATQAPSTIFLCVDPHAAPSDVAQFPAPNAWSDVLEAIENLIHEPHHYKTLVIDTLDSLESLVWLQVCSTHGVSQIEEINYRKGYELAVYVWNDFFEALERLRTTRCMNIILIGNACCQREAKTDQEGLVSRYSLRLHERAIDVLRSWADAILFANYCSLKTTRVFVQTSFSTHVRLMYTEPTESFYAYNRWALPSVIPLAWADFIDALEIVKAASIQLLKAQIESLLPIVPDRKRAEKAYYEWAGDDSIRLKQLLTRMRERIREEESMPMELAQSFN